MGIKRLAVYAAALLLGLVLAAAFVYSVPAVPPPLIYEQF